MIDSIPEANHQTTNPLKQEVLLLQRSHLCDFDKNVLLYS